MKKREVSELFLYKNRYVIGYVGLALIFASVLVFLARTSQNGLTEAEMSSTVESYRFGANGLFGSGILNFPYKLLQKLSVSVFGLSVFSIKLPSLVLAFLSGVGLIVILNRWFKNNVAVLASAIVVTTGIFLFAASSGTPDIMYIFWPTALLIFGSLILNEKKPSPVAVIGLFVTGALALYTPYMIYVLVAILVASLLHPHLRFGLKSAPKIPLVIGVVAGAMIVVPFVISIFFNTDTLWLAALPKDFEIGGLWSNLKLAFTPFVSFNNVTEGIILTPILGLASTALLVIGLICSIKEWHSSRNYILGFWIVFTILVWAIAPDKIVLAFLPIAVLLTSGVEYLLDRWNSLFPMNPYARVGGLVPVMFLVLVTITTGVGYFRYGYRYTPQVAKNFNGDISLVNENIDGDTVILATEGTMEYDFYKILESRDGVRVTDGHPGVNQQTVIALRSYGSKDISNMRLSKIVTSAKTDESDRLYVYSKADSER